MQRQNEERDNNNHSPRNLSDNNTSTTPETMNIGTLTMLEPRPIDPRRMIPVPNVSLIQSTLNDRILLDLHPLLEMGKADFEPSQSKPAHCQPSDNLRTPFKDDSSKKLPAKATTQLRKEETSIFPWGKNLSSLLVASSYPTGDDTEPIPYATTSVGRHEQNVQDDDDDSSSVALNSHQDTEASVTSSDPLVFRLSQLEQWNARFQELIQFKEEHHHCNVPLHYPNNRSLAHWVKRQRHMYRMKKEGKHSTLTEERQQMLESLGFVWDSHRAVWDERWNQLSQFRDEHGHSRVPKNYPPNPPLVSRLKNASRSDCNTFSHVVSHCPPLLSFRQSGSNVKDANSNCFHRASLRI